MDDALCLKNITLWEIVCQMWFTRSKRLTYFMTWYYFIPKILYVMLNFFKALGRIMLSKSKRPFWSFKNYLGFTWRQDCVLFHLLDCVSKVLLTQHVIKSDNAKFLHWSINYDFFFTVHLEENVHQSVLWTSQRQLDIFCVEVV